MWLSPKIVRHHCGFPSNRRWHPLRKKLWPSDPKLPGLHSRWIWRTCHSSRSWWTASAGFWTGIWDIWWWILDVQTFQTFSLIFRRTHSVSFNISPPLQAPACPSSCPLWFPRSRCSNASSSRRVEWLQCSMHYRMGMGQKPTTLVP